MDFERHIDPKSNIKIGLKARAFKLDSIKFSPTLEDRRFDTWMFASCGEEILTNKKLIRNFLDKLIEGMIHWGIIIILFPSLEEDIKSKEEKKKVEVLIECISKNEDSVFLSELEKKEILFQDKIYVIPVIEKKRNKQF